MEQNHPLQLVAAGYATSSSSDDESQAEDSPKREIASPKDKTISSSTLPLNNEDLITLSEAAEAHLPPRTDNKCSESIQSRIETYIGYRDQGHDFMENLEGKKDFRNPYLLAKVVEFFDIDETSTNMDQSVYDPHRFSQEDYYDGLRKKQNEFMERLAYHREQAFNAHFSKNTVASNTAAKYDNKKASRWDQN